MALNEQEWLADFTSKLEHYQTISDNDPQTNPVKLLAYDLSRLVENRDLEFRDIEAIVKVLSDRAAIKRSKRLRSRSGLDRIDALRDQFTAIAQDKAEQDFETFKAWCEFAGQGIVLTAHPTFSLSEPVYTLLGELASRDADNVSDLEEKLKDLPFLRKSAPSLLEEHQQAQSVLLRLQTALDEINTIVLTIAKSSFPDRWHELTPCLVKIYSWVGYDIDGRTDIGWGDALRLRLEEKQRQLTLYDESLSEISDAHSFSSSGKAAIKSLKATLNNALQSTGRDLTLFQKDLAKIDNLVAAANHLTRQSKRRLRSAHTLYPLLNAAIEGVSSDQGRLALLRLRARIRCNGLGTSRIHFRVNSRHVLDGLRADFDLDGANLSDQRTFGKLMAKKIAEQTPVTVNFASLALEKNTAHRQMILIAQIHKYIDHETPIRFLIAECEDSIIPLGMLYLAKHYGLEAHIDISPLFETSSALNNAGRIMDKMLSHDVYKDYVKRRGVFAIQTGFSDAGRFMGQIPATLAIERLQSHMANVIAAHGLGAVTSIIFNTHGESMGRGSHPGSLHKRLAYVMSPWAMQQFEKRDLRFCHETSFQGGDGFLWFQNAALTEASVFQIALSRYQDRSGAEDDVFYVNRDFSWDIYRTLSSEQERLYNDPNYPTILGRFSQNLLIPTGSRAAKRPDNKASTQTMDPRQLRAIPHNAILQQYGVPVNTFFGVGRAAQIDPEKFDELYEMSDRAKIVLDLALTSKRRSDIYILTAYGRLFDPGFWLARALSGGEPGLKQKCKTIAQILMRNPLRTEIVDLANMLRLDHLEFHRNLSEHAFEDSDIRRILSALRIALIMKMYILAAELPRFASAGSGKMDVLERLQNLEVDMIVNDLKEEYPEVWSDMSWTERLNEKNDESITKPEGGPALVETVIKPLARAAQITKQITVALTHHYDAFG